MSLYIIGHNGSDKCSRGLITKGQFWKHFDTGASALKIGAQADTAKFAPQQTRQYPRSGPLTPLLVPQSIYDMPNLAAVCPAASP